MIFRFAPVCVSIIILSQPLIAQDTTQHREPLPRGLSVEYGIGSYSVRDEYVSPEKYSGTLPTFGASWASGHDTYSYHLALQFQQSKEITNYNVSAEIVQFSLNQGFLYTLPSMSLFSKDLYAFLGPSTEIFVYYNKQQIAVSGFDYSQSFAVLFSLGLNSGLVYPIAEGFQAEGSLGFSLLSLALRSVDTEEEDESPARLLTLFTGVNGSFRLGVRYYLWEDLSLAVAYRLQVTNITSWTPLLAASDNVIGTLTFSL